MSSTGTPQQTRASAFNMDGSKDGGSPTGGRSRSGSHASQQKAPNPFGPSMGFDPAKPQGGPEKEHQNTRIDPPPESFLNPGASPFIRRPGYNTAGKPVNLEVNQFRVKEWDDKKTIFQYDVTISPPPLKYNVVFKKCWESPAVQEMLKKYKCLWLQDGRKLAWYVLSSFHKVMLNICLINSKVLGSYQPWRGAPQGRSR